MWCNIVFNQDFILCLFYVFHKSRGTFQGGTVLQTICVFLLFNTTTKHVNIQYDPNLPCHCFNLPHHDLSDTDVFHDLRHLNVFTSADMHDQLQLPKSLMVDPFVKPFKKITVLLSNLSNVL